MNNHFLLQEFEALDQLKDNGEQVQLGKDFLLLAVEFHVLVEVHVEVLEHDDGMLPEFEVVHHGHRPVAALVVLVHVLSQQLLQQLDFDVCIVDVELFVFADFQSDQDLVGVLVVDALDDLAECSLVDDLDRLVPVTQLLSLLQHVVPFVVG